MYEAILGPAGVGKSFTLNQRIAQDPQYALRTSSTGISAVNLGGGATTINSALGYFDTKSLLLSVASKKVNKKLLAIEELYKNLGIDEISMLSAANVDLIFHSIEEFNRTYNKSLGLVTSGDPAQLPSVDGKPFFLAKCWDRFKVTALNEVKRQTDIDFISALHLIRKGRADLAANWFEENVEFSNTVDRNFIGTTFYSLNVDVDTYNYQALKRIDKPSKRYESFVTGTKPCPSWREIPPYVELKEGALIILLINKMAEGYANGDLATVLEMYDSSILVKLHRNNRQVVIQNNTLKYTPVGSKKETGKITYLPVRLAWATSIHKSQSLTLDAVQLKLGGTFLPRLSGGLYTALSRVRTKEGLRLVGTKEDFIKSCYIDPLYLEYLNTLNIA